MTVTIIKKGTPQFQSILEQVSRELVAIDRSPAGDFIRTPLTYPGGSMVVVQVGETDRSFFVSDFGMARDEAELMGVNPSAFAKYALAIADSTGTRFDNHSFFVVEATKEQLPGAIISVANASQAAVVHTAMRLADKTDQTEALLFERLQSVFAGRNVRVVREAKVLGFSTTPWRVDALVQSKSARTIFEAVGKHPASIAAATTKFFDISKAEDAPRRVAVVRSKRELGTYLGVLTQAANVIEDTAPKEAIIQLAEAA